MRNISILFSSISATVFVFGLILYFVTHDPITLKFTGIAVAALLVATAFIVSFALESNECKIRRQHEYNNDQETIWNKFNESERSMLEELTNSERAFSDRVHALWNEVGMINDKIENCSNRKK